MQVDTSSQIPVIPGVTEDENYRRLEEALLASNISGDLLETLIALIARDTQADRAAGIATGTAISPQVLNEITALLEAIQTALDAGYTHDQISQVLNATANVGSASIHLDTAVFMQQQGISPSHPHYEDTYVFLVSLALQLTDGGTDMHDAFDTIETFNDITTRYDWFNRLQAIGQSPAVLVAAIAESSPTNPYWNIIPFELSRLEAEHAQHTIDEAHRQEVEELLNDPAIPPGFSTYVREYYVLNNLTIEQLETLIQTLAAIATELSTTATAEARAYLLLAIEQGHTHEVLVDVLESRLLEPLRLIHQSGLSNALIQNLEYFYFQNTPTEISDNIPSVSQETWVSIIASLTSLSALESVDTRADVSRIINHLLANDGNEAALDRELQELLQLHNHVDALLEQAELPLDDPGIRQVMIALVEQFGYQGLVEYEQLEDIFMLLRLAEPYSYIHLIHAINDSDVIPNLDELNRLDALLDDVTAWEDTLPLSYHRSSTTFPYEISMEQYNYLESLGYFERPQSPDYGFQQEPEFNSDGTVTIWTGRHDGKSEVRVFLEEKRAEASGGTPLERFHAFALSIQTGAEYVLQYNQIQEDIETVNNYIATLDEQLSTSEGSTIQVPDEIRDIIQKYGLRHHEDFAFTSDSDGNIFFVLSASSTGSQSTNFGAFMEEVWFPKVDHVVQGLITDYAESVTGQKVLDQKIDYFLRNVEQYTAAQREALKQIIVTYFPEALFESTTPLPSELVGIWELLEAIPHAERLFFEQEFTAGPVYNNTYYEEYDWFESQTLTTLEPGQPNALWNLQTFLQKHRDDYYASGQPIGEQQLHTYIEKEIIGSRHYSIDQDGPTLYDLMSSGQLTLTPEEFTDLYFEDLPDFQEGTVIEKSILFWDGIEGTALDGHREIADSDDREIQSYEGHREEFTEFVADLFRDYESMGGNASALMNEFDEIVLELSQENGLQITYAELKSRFARVVSAHRAAVSDIQGESFQATFGGFLFRAQHQSFIRDDYQAQIELKSAELRLVTEFLSEIKGGTFSDAYEAYMRKHNLNGHGDHRRSELEGRIKIINDELNTLTTRVQDATADYQTANDQLSSIVARMLRDLLQGIIRNF